MSKKQRHQEKLENTKRREMNILWSSNGPHTNSGYAVETRDLLFRFVKDGWNTACVAFWGSEGYPTYQYGQDLIDERFKDVKLKVYPKMDHPYGSDAIIAHALDYKANVVITMQDVPMLDPQHLQQLKYWVPYVPIDKDPCPPGVLDRLRYAYKIITFSKFGQETLLKHGFTSTLILEGTDPELLKPIDKAQARKDFGIPQDAFIFGMIAANKENPPRKSFQESLEAFKRFSDNHPEAKLFIHSQQRGPGGFPVEEFAHYLGLKDKIIYMLPYQAVFNSDSKRIAKEMSCFDVLLHPSRTEGFGLTVVEALSCGVPVIVNNTTSMPEMVKEGVTGFICETDKKGWWSNDNSYVYSPDVQSLYDKMEASYKLVKEKGAETAKACRNFVLENYDIDKLYQNKWKTFLEELQEEILPLQPALPAVQLNQLNTPLAGQ
jgi:glycosyltransferase involved in cell wall biosynthesis